jgi:hypothetical protein
MIASCFSSSLMKASNSTSLVYSFTFNRLGLRVSEVGKKCYFLSN